MREDFNIIGFNYFLCMHKQQTNPLFIRLNCLPLGYLHLCWGKKSLLAAHKHTSWSLFLAATMLSICQNRSWRFHNFQLPAFSMHTLAEDLSCILSIKPTFPRIHLQLCGGNFSLLSVHKQTEWYLFPVTTMLSIWQNRSWRFQINELHLLSMPTLAEDISCILWIKPPSHRIYEFVWWKNFSLLAVHKQMYWSLFLVTTMLSICKNKTWRYQNY